MKNILILGAYGQDNIGDEGLLESVLDNLDKSKINNIFVNSSNPEYTSRKYLVKAFHTNIITNPIGFIKAVIHSDIIIYGGGTLIVELRMDSWIKNIPIIKMAILNFIAKILGKRIVYLGMGTEVLKLKSSKFFTKFAMKFCDMCFCRDEESYNLLLEYTHSDKVKLSSDLVYQTKYENQKKNDEDNKILILPLYRIIEFDQYFEKYIDSLVEFIENNSKNYKFTLYPMRRHEKDKYNDEYVISLINEKLSVKVECNYEHYDPKQFLQFVSQFKFVFSSRFHGLIYSLLAGIPCVSITNFEKNQSLFKSYGLLDYSISSKDITANTLESTINNLEDNLPKLKELINMNNARLKSLGSNQFEYIKTLL